MIRRRGLAWRRSMATIRSRPHLAYRDSDLGILFSSSTPRSGEPSPAVKVSAIEFLIAEVAEKKQLPVSARAELSGLSANEIWALNDFSIGNTAVLVTK